MKCRGRHDASRMGRGSYRVSNPSPVPGLLTRQPLVRYEAAQRALIEAKSVDEVKDIRDKAEAMRVYAHQAKNRQLEVDAVEIRMRAERRLGEMIRAQKETVGLAKGGGDTSTGSRKVPVQEPPTLAEAGIDKKLSSRAQKLAAVSEDKFERLLSEWRQHAEQENERVTTNLLLFRTQPANYSSASVEWYTPAFYVEAARKVLKNIDLDPASNNLANKTVKAKKFFAANDCPLERNWAGKVFMNPPYGIEKGESVAAMFCNKAIEEYEAGRVSEAILLVNSVHSQKWQEPLFDHVFCLVDHRIKFIAGDGTENENPTFQNIFVYLGPRKREFAAVFSDFGYVAERVRGQRS